MHLRLFSGDCKYWANSVHVKSGYGFLYRTTASKYGHLVDYRKIKQISAVTYISECVLFMLCGQKNSKDKHEGFYHDHAFHSTVIYVTSTKKHSTHLVASPIC